MPDLTTNYNLEKPLATDYVDIGLLNDNMDKIDAALTPTADPAQVPTGLSGKLSQWMSWITNRIKAITGATNWYDTPATTLSAANTHANSTAAHSATSAATGNRIMARDSGGRAKVAAPAAADDIARKDTVDVVQGNLDTHLADGATNNNLPHGATPSATANKIMARDANGRVKVAAPSASDDVARLDTINTVAQALRIRSFLGV